MHSSRLKQATKLEDIPNIGKSIAADLRAIGILNPHQLAGRDPFSTYIELSGAMGHRHDPCVLYVLMSAQHFLESGVAIPWWKFTEQGKKLLASKGKLRGLPSTQVNC
jgi:orotidine-5'-phosphate decarboxylase